MENEILLDNLKKRRFIPVMFEEADLAKEYLLTVIPQGSTIGFGGSMTVKELELPDFLINHGYTVYHNSVCPDIDKDTLYSLQASADFYICSTNALSVSGDLINIDGRANRVSAMLFGPKNIIILCGSNKIVNSVEEGIKRVRNIASPPNCVRLNKKTPCAVTGKCEYCNSPDTICNATVIQHHPTTGKKFHIIIINKNLGY